MEPCTSEAVVTLWAAGVQASHTGKTACAPLDRRGCVEVDDRLNPPGLPEIFVLGDLAHLEQDGHQIPGVAQPRHADGRPRSQNHCRRSGEEIPTRLPLLRQGRHATIGRMDAVAKVEWPFKAHMSGFPAWAAWLVVHIFFLIGFATASPSSPHGSGPTSPSPRGARLITGDQRLPGWQDPTGRWPAEKQTGASF